MRLVLILAVSLLLFPAAAARADAVDQGFRRADALFEKGDFAKARAAFAEALAKLMPDDARVIRGHERSGAAFLREGKVGEARAAFTAALKAAQRLKASSADAARAYAGMGLCLRRESRDAYALRFFKKALDLPVDDGTRMFAEDQIREIEGAPAR